MRGSALIAAAAAAAAVSVHAGQGGSSQSLPPQQGLVFTTRTQGVLVDVLVTERNRPVAGLTAADFSGSTEGQRITDLKAASAAFVDGLRPRDRIALTTFTHAVAPRVTLTEEFGSIGAALNALKPGGETAILDGVHVALMATQAEPGRSLVVVFTDGRDTMSWLQDDEVVESAKRSNGVIYAVATGRARSWPVLQNLADTTGGRALEIETGDDLHRQFERILLEFRSRYVLTYVPRGVPDTGFHRLSVRAWDKIAGAWYAKGRP
jgi:hypothetical protein